ncbi:MAG: hypothetical protein GX232_03320 [Acholeplasmataceae bacterium]|nr:hypothetical protein [Acholeplasmataceae bacterium]
MKRLLLIFTILFSTLLLSSCKKIEDPSILLPAGSPLIGMAEALDGIEHEIVVGADSFPAAFVKGERDIIIAPAVLGVKLYNEGKSKYQLASVFGWNNLYIISNDNITSLSELSGKQIIAFGEFATPGIVLRTVLGNLEANISYVGSVSDVVAPFMQKTYDAALISEPFISVIKSKTANHNFSILDLSEEEKVPPIAQVGIFVNPNSNNKAGIDNFLSKAKLSIESLNKDPKAYSKKAVSLQPRLKDLGEEVIASAIPNLNLDYVSLDLKTKLEPFLQFLINNNDKQLIGDKLPQVAFYYSK